MPLEKTTIKGTWWQEDQPSNQLQGEITYGPLSGAEVDLFGQFQDTFSPATQAKRFTLLGLTLNAKQVSLFGCLALGGQMHIPGAASSKVKSIAGVVGGHYRSLDDVKFKQVSASFTGLREWVWTSGITAALGQDLQEINATYRLPPLLPLGQLGPLNLAIEFSVHAQPGFHSLSIEQDCTLLIRADQMQPYALFERCISSFQQFLTLALQRSAYPTKITGQTDQPRETIGETPIFEEFLVIRSRSSAETERRDLIPQDLLFTSHELTGSPAEAFARFVQRQTILAASMDLYFSTFHHSFSFPRVRFLTLAQSLEAYHRAAMPGRYMTGEEYRAGLRQRLSDAIPKDDQAIGPDFRASLDKKLDYLHEYSLRKRLKEIASKHSAILERLIGSPDAFSTAVSEKRNQLTHAGSQDPGAAEDYRELWALSDKMTLLLEVCFLDEIGFTQERLKQIVTSRSNCARRVQQGWV